MNERTQIVMDNDTAKKVGALAGGILSACGHAELAPLVPVAASILQRLCDAGYEVPSLDEFSAKLDEFAARPDVPTE